MSGRIESKRTDAKLISRQKRHSDSEQRVKVSLRLYDRLEASLVLERERSAVVLPLLQPVLVLLLHKAVEC